jgi:amino acid transporter
MSDEWREPDEHDESDDARGAVSDLRFASSLLRAAAIVAAVLWLVALVASTLFQLDQFRGIDQLGGQMRPSPVLAALAAGLNNTWGYLLVAVVAFAAATLLARPGGSESPLLSVDGDDD